MTNRNWKLWCRCALVRALKTFAQTFAGCLTVGAAAEEISWLRALSVSCVAFIFSMMTSLGGLPEADEQEGV